MEHETKEILTYTQTSTVTHRAPSSVLVVFEGTLGIVVCIPKSGDLVCIIRKEARGVSVHTRNIFGGHGSSEGVTTM
jgi:hypothetical protein